MFRAAISRCTRLVPSAAASSASLSLRNRRAFAASAALHLAPKVTCFFHKDTNTCTYVVEDEETKKSAIIDSVLDYNVASSSTATTAADEVIAYIKAQGLTNELILESHVHADHITASWYLKQKIGGKIVIGADVVKVQDTFAKIYNIPIEWFSNDGFDVKVSEGDVIKIGSLTMKVFHTPGHTPACSSYLIGDAVFVGDTIFMPDYGSARCDFPNGSAETLYRSIKEKLFQLSDDTRLFVGHDYLPSGGTRKDFAWQTTVGDEKRANIHLSAMSEEEFVKMRSERDKKLGVPRLLIPSLQMNLRAGQAPPPEANGVSYLKFPLNVFK